ncbi:MAG: hypothetical protein K9K79_11590 [Desulfohalobiaceae bacterium]|nr:hypothetical protein [Desulfohalobiaceae bacterium]
MEIKKEDIAAKLKTIYPEINQFGLDMQLAFDTETNAWIATFHTGEHELSTHLEQADVENCLLGKECIHLGHQLGRFIRNFCEGGGACSLGQS